jgi:hypothetical protein
MSYFPKLKRQPKIEGEDEEPEVLFNFSARLRSGDQFKQICHSKNFEIDEVSLNEVTI